MERGNGTRKHGQTGRQRDEPEEKDREKANQQPRLVTTRGLMLGWLVDGRRVGEEPGLAAQAHMPSVPRVWPMRQDEYPYKRRLNSYKAVEWAIAAKELGFPKQTDGKRMVKEWRASRRPCSPR